MLQLILGRTGTGKTNKIFEIIAELTNKNENEVYLIVPEQFSFYTEREFTRKFAQIINEKKIQAVSDATSRCHVVTFTRLCDHIFRKCGKLSGERVSAISKFILMQKAFAGVSPELKCFRKKKIEFGNVINLLEEVESLKNHGIKSADLLSVTSEIDQTLAMKMNDIALIFESYQSLLDASFLDPSDDLERAVQLASESGFFENKFVLIDEFKSFSTPEINMMNTIIRQCEKCFCSFCTDGIWHDAEEEQSDFSPFWSAKETIHKLMGISRKSGTPVAKPIILTEQFRYKSRELSLIEQNLAAEKIIKSDKMIADSGITLMEASTIYGEIEMAAAEISRLVMEESYRYSQITIICRELEMYKKIVSRIFPRYQIPVFCDEKNIISEYPVVAFFLALLDCLKQGFSTSNIISMMKTNLLPIDYEDILELENYCYIWEIKDKQWKSEFKQNPLGFVPKTDDSENMLRKIEQTRKFIIEPILEFNKKSKKISGKNFAELLYNLLTEFQIDKNVKKKADFYIKEKEINIANEFIRTWDFLIEVLDDFAKNLENTVMKRAEYCELLRGIFTTQKMGFIPQAHDGIILSDADRVCLNNPEIVFVVGVNEGIFPRTVASGGMFSIREKLQLESVGLKLDLTTEQHMAVEKFCSYKSLTGAKEKLYLSRFFTGISGEHYEPSPLFTMIQKALPDVPLLNFNSLQKTDPMLFCPTEKSSFHTLAANFADDTQFNASLREYFEKSDYHSVVNRMKVLSDFPDFYLKNQDNINALFKSKMKLSPTAVEKFMECKFAYFCQYAIKIRQRQKAKLSPLESGSLIHFVLQKIFQENSCENINNLSDSELFSKINSILDQYLIVQMLEIDQRKGQMKSFLKRIAKMLTALVKNMAEEFAQSEFRPVDFELEINDRDDLDLENDRKIYPLDIKYGKNNTISVIGKVDRVDMYTKNNQRFIRIIDYKTGQKQFNLTDVFYGLNMQMLIYLFCICENGTGIYDGVKPAGILYVPAKEVTVNKRSNEDLEAIERKRKKSRCASGIVLDNLEVISAMERDIDGLYIPVILGKDGLPKDKKTVATLEQFGKLKRHIENELALMAETLQKGMINAVPTYGKKYNCCDYCDYKKVCNISEDAPAIQMTNMNPDEFWNELGEQKCEIGQ